MRDRRLASSCPACLALQRKRAPHPFVATGERPFPLAGVPPEEQARMRRPIPIEEYTARIAPASTPWSAPSRSRRSCRTCSPPGASRRGRRLPSCPTHEDPERAPVEPAHRSAPATGNRSKNRPASRPPGDGIPRSPPAGDGPDRMPREQRARGGPAGSRRGSSSQAPLQERTMRVQACARPLCRRAHAHATTERLGGRVGRHSAMR